MSDGIKKKIVGIQPNKDFTSFQARLRLKGCDVSKNFTSITRAKKWLSVKRAEIELGMIDELSLSHKYTLADLVDRYISVVLPLKPKNAVNTKRILLWWKKELGHLLIRDVKPSLISQKRDQLLFEPTKRGEKRSPSTVVRYLSSLSHAFSIAVKEWEWLRENPVFKISKPKESQGRTRFLDSKEKEALLNACYEIDP